MFFDPLDTDLSVLNILMEPRPPQLPHLLIYTELDSDYCR